jgi:hypothetical protein
MIELVNDFLLKQDFELIEVLWYGLNWGDGKYRKKCQQQ